MDFDGRTAYKQSSDIPRCEPQAAKQLSRHLRKKESHEGIEHPRKAHSGSGAEAGRKRSRNGKSNDYVAESYRVEERQTEQAPGVHQGVKHINMEEVVGEAAERGVGRIERVLSRVDAEHRQRDYQQG